MKRSTVGICLACSLAAPVQAGPAQFFLISDARQAQASATVTDGVNGDSEMVSESAPPLLPWTILVTAEATYQGVTAQGSASQTSALETDVLGVAVESHASIGPAGLLAQVSTSASTFAQVVFEVTEPTDVLIQVAKQGVFISHDIRSQGTMQLWREDPCPLPCTTSDDCPFGDCGANGFCASDNCLVHDFDTCGTVTTLVPGTYLLQVSTLSFAQSFNGSEPFGGSADGASLVSVSTLDASTDLLSFAIDPGVSVTVTVQFPDAKPQVFVISLSGTVDGQVSLVCGAPATLAVTDIDFTSDDSVEVMVPGAGLGPGGVITVSDIAVGLTAPGSPAELVDGSGVLLGYEIQGTAQLGPGAAVGIGYPILQAILDCLLDLLCTDPQQCGGESPSPPGTLPYDTLVFPGIDFTTSLDLGLGAMNPTMQVTGDITMTLVPPCPWDCDGSDDGNVNVTDLLALLAQYDPLAPAVCDGGESCDYDGNGCVDVTDLLKLLSHYTNDPGGIGCP